MEKPKKSTTVTVKTTKVTVKPNGQTEKVIRTGELMLSVLN